MTKTNPFRIAIRREGAFVNAYFAPPDSMEGAILMGSVRTSILQKTPGAMEAYQELMKSAIATACSDTIGAVTEFRVEPAPESERSGHA